jgi:zinc protease
LNEWIATGDWTQFVRFLDAVEKVTPADVQRVAKTHLNEDQSTTGWFVPVAKGK